MDTSIPTATTLTMGVTDMEMSTSFTREDLPRLTDAGRDALQDDYSVTPAAMDDEQLARRDLSTMERLYVAQAEHAIDETADQGALTELVDAHRDYRNLWMKSARDARGRQVRGEFVRRARQCSRLVVLARRRMRSRNELVRGGPTGPDRGVTGMTTASLGADSQRHVLAQILNGTAATRPGVRAPGPVSEAALNRGRPSLALTCARRLSHFARYSFDPTSDGSWLTADRLYRAARMAMDAEREARP